MTQDKLLQRLVKLLNMADGAAAVGNANEAEVFAAKAQELLVTHKLSMSDIEMARQDVDDPMGETTLDPRDVGIKPRGVRMDWQERLAMEVAYSHCCKILVYARSNRVCFIGRDQDREMAVYVYTILVRTAERLVKQEYRRFKKSVGGAGYQTKGFMAAFYLGFVHGVQERLCRERDELEAAKRAAGSGMALIRLSDARTAVQTWIDKKYSGTLSSSPARQSNASNAHAYTTGKRHGANTLTNKPVSGPSSSTRSLPR